ncbi:MAG: CRTAC1 family protein [Acidimicrobiia bacterium]
MTGGRTMPKWATVVVALAVVGAACSGATEPTESLAPPAFVDDSQVAGVVHAYIGDWKYFEGGGVAAFDCSGDELPELFFAGGEGAAVLYRNVSEAGGPLAFTELEGTGLELDAVTGAYPIDIDSDGIADLVVLRLGENVVFRGTGGCGFERANELWNIDGGDVWTAAFSATWEPEAIMPTLAFGNYLDADALTEDVDLCSANVLLRPDRATYAPPVTLGPGWCTLSVLFSDWDRNGTADLRVTNDRQYNTDGEEVLWQIDANQPPIAYARDEGWKLLRIWGMGIASHDITGDSYPDVYLTNQGDSKLQTLAEGPDQPRYEDIAIRRGATVHKPYVGDQTLPSTGWHAEFDDVNNDGFIDLYVAKGNVDAMPSFTDADPNNLLIGQPDGTFLEGAEEAGIVYFDKTRGAALVDLNSDGLLDLVEVNRVENVRLWRNVGSGTADSPAPMGNWIEVSLAAGDVNSAGVGSWIDVRIGEFTITREVTIGGGHASGELGAHHFGIGPSSSAEVRVTWPDGSSTDWIPATAGEQLTVSRAS